MQRCSSSRLSTMPSASELNIKTIDVTQSVQSMPTPVCNMLPCKMTRTQKSILVTLSLLKFVALASFSVIAPFFPSEAKEKQVPELVIGAVFTVYAAANFATSPIFGKIIATVGPKIVLITGTCVLGTASLLFGVLDLIEDSTTFSALSISIRVIEGIGCGAAGTAIFTYIAEVFPRRTGIIMGVMEIMTGIGLSTGPAVGGYLYAIGGYKTPFIVLGGICLATVPINAVLLPTSMPNEGPHGSKKHQPVFKTVSKWNLAVSPKFLIAAASISAISCGTAFLSPLLEPHLNKLGMSASGVGTMFLFTPLAYGLVSPISGYISDENPSLRRLQTGFGLLLVGISFLLIGPSPLLHPLKSVLWLNIVALCVKGLGSTFAVVPTFQIMLDCATDIGIPNNLATHGMISGLWSSAWSFGEIIGPTLGTLISSHVGFRWAATVQAGVCFSVMMLMWLSHVTEHLKKPEEENSNESSQESTSLLPH